MPKLWLCMYPTPSPLLTLPPRRGTAVFYNLKTTQHTFNHLHLNLLDCLRWRSLRKLRKEVLEAQSCNFNWPKTDNANYIQTSFLFTLLEITTVLFVTIKTVMPIKIIITFISVTDPLVHFYSCWIHFKLYLLGICIISQSHTDLLQMDQDSIFHILENNSHT